MLLKPMDGRGWTARSVRSVWFTAVLLLFAMGGPDVRGQDTNTDEARRTAITLGLGASSILESDTPITFLLHGAHTRDWHRFVGRIASAADVVAERGQTDLAVLDGPALSWSWGQVSGGSGIVLTWGERTSSSAPRTVPGLPVGTTLYLTPPIGYGTVGVTASAFANVNERQSFGGLTFERVVGDLR